MRRKIDEAAEWKSTSSPCGTTYWYSTVDLTTTWAMPDICAEVKSKEFTQRFSKLQANLEAAKARRSSPPPTPGVEGRLFAVKSSSPAPAMFNPEPLSPSTCQPDYTKLLLSSKEDLKAAAASFHDLCARKSMSYHPSSSYHITFARTFKEGDFAGIFHSMGLKIYGEDDQVDKDLPFAESSDKNPSMPIMKVFLMARSASAGPDKLTFEWHRGDKQIWIKAGRYVIVDRLCLLLAFLGRISDVRGVQSYGKSKVPRKPLDLEFGPSSVNGKIDDSLGLVHRR